MAPNQTSDSSKRPLLSMAGITKSFPGVLANDAIDLDIYASEIHALLGENGAGKSTLVKILYGFYRSDSGSIKLNGQELQIQSPSDARQAQIGLVFQDFSLIPTFTVAENIALFLTDLKAILDLKEIENRINEVSSRYQLDVDPRKLVSQLSLGDQQKVEILKLLLSNARILILDEPTRVLAPHEISALFNVLENLKKDGYAIILITHKMEEVIEFADRVTVLRKGKVSGNLIRSGLSEENLIQLMFAKQLESPTKQQASLPVFERNPLLGTPKDRHPGNWLIDQFKRGRPGYLPRRNCRGGRGIRKWAERTGGSGFGNGTVRTRGKTALWAGCHPLDCWQSAQERGWLHT